MRILILGATGRTGKLLLQEALYNGYAVNVLLRDKNRLKISHPLLNVFEGLPTDKYVLTQAMQGYEAVLSALNISRKSDFPRAKLRTPPALLSDTAELIIELAPQNNIRKVIVTSAWGVGDSWQYLPWWFRWLISHSNIGAGYTDHNRQEELLAASNLNYTAVRPVGLINSAKSKPVCVSFNNIPKPRFIISRKDVAKFMIYVLKNDSLGRKMPVIFYP